MRRSPARTPWPLALLAALGTACAALATLGLARPAQADGFDALFTQDGVDVWAVGGTGKYWRSFDGGANWVSRPALGTRGLHGVAARGLNAIAVGDSGHVWRSSDSGGTWALVTLPGAPVLTGLEWPADTAAFAVGDGGGIWVSKNAGASWAPQASGTVLRLNAVRFRDALNGWAVGRGGTALKTVNGGTTWTAANVPNAGSDLLSVDFVGADVWAVGAFAVAYKSANAGAAWSPVDLHMDSRGDVRRVWMTSAAQVALTGGGGFLRKTVDGGATWTFATHPMLAPTASYFAFGATQAWLAAATSPTVVRTVNGGATWSFPSGTNTTYAWTQKQPAPFTIIRGDPFAVTPQNRNSVWCVMGPYVFKSTDRGESWTAIDTIPGASKVNSFYVSPKDSTHWVAVVGTPDQIERSLDSGATWTTTLSRDFGEYGSPLEMHPDKPDTLLFGPEDGYLYRSLDFGATWDTLSHPGFRSPCDITITPGDDSKVLVADGVTGQGFGTVLQSVDGGQTFQLRFTGVSSENPTLWTSRLANNVHYVTNWSSGGVWKSTDFGANWNMVSSVSSAWGGAASMDDPMATAFSRYAGTPNYLSLDQGASFLVMNLSNFGSGYALLGLDRSTWLDLHSAGIYKLVTTHIVSSAPHMTIALTAPNGGESWAAGSVHALTWLAPNIGLAHLEYRTSPFADWQPVADVPAYLGTYAWTVPATPTTSAQVRVSDAWAPGVRDTADAAFTIAAPVAAVTPASLAYGSHPVGSATLDSLRISNPGTATLHVTSIAADDPAFVPGRTSLTLAPGASDTLGVTFSPGAAQAFSATLTLTHDAGPATAVPLAGSASSLPQVVVLAPGAGSAWQYNRARNVLWQSLGTTSVALDYRTSEVGAWLPIVSGVPAAAGQYAWTVPNAATAQARVRVRDVGGSPAGTSALFSIVVPGFGVSPSPYDFGTVPPGFAAWDTLHVSNPGTAPLTVSSVTSDNAHFVPGRTAFTVPAGGSDTLAVTFQSPVVGADSALFTFTGDDPAATHTLRVRGTAANVAAVGDKPTAFAFEGGFPNPFTRAITLRFALPERADVRLDVFTTDGRRVQSLVHGMREPGAYTVLFEPRASLPSGVYFVRLQAGAFERTRKILHVSR